MPKKEKSLSEIISDDILAMITIDKRFSVGDKLPNENELIEILYVPNNKCENKDINRR